MSVKAVGAAEMAGLLGITPRRLQQLAQIEGFPKTERGQYIPPDVIGWYVAYKEAAAKREAQPADLDEARLRKMAAEAALAEYELAEMEGKMVAVEDIDRILAPPLTALRAKLLNLPGKLAPQLLACRSLAEIRTLLDTSIAEAMAELQGVGESSEDERMAA